MQIYTATIRLSGSLFNEVRRDDLTAPEIMILRRIHGRDALHGIAATSHVAREDHEERERLTGIYARALAGIKGVGTIDVILGPEGSPLVKAVPGVDILPPPKTGKRLNTFGRDKPKAEEPAEPIAQEEFS